MELIIKATSVADLREQIAGLNSIMSGQYMGAATANIAPAKTTTTAAVVYDIEPATEEKPAAKKTKTKKETVAEVVDSAPATEAAVSTELDFKALQETLQRLATKKGLSECSKILSKFKVRVLKELPQAQYQQFQHACQESLG